jgi:hypothetical protein
MHITLIRKDIQLNHVQKETRMDFQIQCKPGSINKKIAVGSPAHSSGEVHNAPAARRSGPAGLRRPSRASASMGEGPLRWCRGHQQRAPRPASHCEDQVVVPPLGKPMAWRWRGRSTTTSAGCSSSSTLPCTCGCRHCMSFLSAVGSSCTSIVHARSWINQVQNH